MAKGARHVKRSEWAKETEAWVGRVIGKDIGADATLLFFSSVRIGAGPPLHVHEYDEIFIIRQGRAMFTVGESEFEAEAGDIVFGPAGVPHKFRNLGPGLLETTDIHLSDHFAQIDLEDLADEQ